MVPDGGRLRVDAPAGCLTAADRSALAEHKAELLALLGSPWDQVEADHLIAEVQVRRQQRFGESMSPADSAARRQLFGLADRIDDAWLARDLLGLREAVAACQAALDGAASDEEAAVCRVIELDLGLPEGSLQLYPPPRGCRGCDWCRATGKEPQPDPGEDLFSVHRRIAKQREERKVRRPKCPGAIAE
jgi:hypothetical protein